MLGHDPYYYGTIRKAVVAFGALFSDIKIKRMKADGTLGQMVKVPISYSGKEKWVVRTEGDPNLTKQTKTVLPRLAFELEDFTYDSSRKVGRLNTIAVNGTNTAESQYSPVPYNVSISLYLLTKTTEDALAVAEQVLPFFTPEYTLYIDIIPEMGIMNEVPVILNGVSVEDEYDGDFQTSRQITYTFNFTMKMNLFGPIKTKNITTNTATSNQISLNWGILLFYNIKVILKVILNE